jgi:3-hydroxyisobutyrate dehydrogenase-like beta-hydroxyacid dehydrogenase
MIAHGNFDSVGFRLPLGLKDNRLLLSAADESSIPMPWPVLCTTGLLQPWRKAWAIPIGL